MKIIYLAAGAADMYCGSCLHDNTLAAALLSAGHDVLLTPTYTPLRTDEPNVSTRKLFFGGINVYLQQHSRLFRRLPAWLDRWLDSPRLLRLAARFGPGVDAARLGDLTVSMLQGEEGRQRKELDRLVTWIASERPDVVHLSNALLLGMARAIRAQGMPLVCSLSGEDAFLDGLVEPYATQAQAAMRSRAADVDAFVPLNRYYGDVMAEYLDLPQERITVIPHGVQLTGYTTHAPREPGAGVVIGYLARVCHAKGLHLLVEAVEKLIHDGDTQPVKLRVAGYLSAADRPYLAAIEQRVAKWPSGKFEYLGELDRPGKISFLQSIDVMSLPTVYRESKGLSVLEALASAVPVVVPDHGAFPEYVADSGGGVLFRPFDSADLARTLAELIRDTAAARRMGLAGQAAVRERYNAAMMASRTAELYERLIGTAGRLAG